MAQLKTKTEIKCPECGHVIKQGLVIELSAEEREELKNLGPKWSPGKYTPAVLFTLIICSLLALTIWGDKIDQWSNWINQSSNGLMEQYARPAGLALIIIFMIILGITDDHRWKKSNKLRNEYLDAKRRELGVDNTIEVRW